MPPPEFIRRRGQPSLRQQASASNDGHIELDAISAARASQRRELPAGDAITDYVSIDDI